MLGKNYIRIYLALVILQFIVMSQEKINKNSWYDLTNFNESMSGYEGQYIQRSKDGYLLELRIKDIDTLFLKYWINLYKAGKGCYIHEGTAKRVKVLQSSDNIKKADFALYEDLGTGSECKTVIKVKYIENNSSGRKPDYLTKVRLLKKCNRTWIDITEETFGLLWKKN